MAKSHYKAGIALTFIKCLDIVLVLALFVCVREYILFGHIVDRSTFYRIEFTLWHFVALMLLSLVWNRIRLYLLRLALYRCRTLCALCLLESFCRGHRSSFFSQRGPADLLEDVGSRLGFHRHLCRLWRQTQNSQGSHVFRRYFANHCRRLVGSDNALHQEVYGNKG